MLEVLELVFPFLWVTLSTEGDKPNSSGTIEKDLSVLNVLSIFNSSRAFPRVGG